MFVDHVQSFIDSVLQTLDLLLHTTRLCIARQLWLRLCLDILRRLRQLNNLLLQLTDLLLQRGSKLLLSNNLLLTLLICGRKSVVMLPQLIVGHPEAGVGTLQLVDFMLKLLITVQRSFLSLDDCLLFFVGLANIAQIRLC